MTDYGLAVAMNGSPDYEKDPSDVIDIPNSWHQLGLDTIVTSTWESDALTIVSDLVDGLTTVAFVSGGTAGALARLTNRVVTGMGRTLERSVFVAVSDL